MSHASALQDQVSELQVCVVVLQTERVSWSRVQEALGKRHTESSLYRAQHRSLCPATSKSGKWEKDDELGIFVRKVRFPCFFLSHLSDHAEHPIYIR
jgi:hypothetical protein